MSSILDQIRKLLALALNNPNEEEARSAAMKAAQLIEEHNIPVGNETVVQPRRSATWKPDKDFDVFWEQAQRQQRPHSGHSGVGGPTDIKVADTDTDLDDDFMRKRIVLAWRAIKAERQKLEGEIWRYETETKRRFPRD